MVVRKRKQGVYDNWIGAPVGSNRPHDFFKTNKKDYPVNMFKDSDKDGVPNVFDCRPNNPNKQGLISAIVGAVRGIGKGEVRKGWDEGMAKPGIIERRRYERTGVLSPRLIKIREKGVRGKALMRQRQAYQEMVSKIAEQNRAERLQKYRELQKNPVVSRINRLRIAQMGAMERIRTQKMTRPMQAKHIALKKGLQMIFPLIPSAATKATYGAQSKTGMQKGPGRPRGSVKYVDDQGRPIGVFAWRALQSQKRQAFRDALRQQSEQIKQQRQIQRMQGTQQMQQQMQVPEEVQGATPEYSQFPQVQEAQPQEEMALASQPPMPEYPAQEMPRQYPSTAGPERTVFKSSGGKPYPVLERPLMPSNTYSDAIEDVDLMTGRRFMRPKPKPERWATGER